MTASHNESESKSSDSIESRMVEMEKVIAYMQHDIDQLKHDTTQLKKQLQSAMTDVAKTKKRVEMWPYVVEKV
jgi:outer membrane murein-binding lipoprotein Lpp